MWELKNRAYASSTVAVKAELVGVVEKQCSIEYRLQAPKCTAARIADGWPDANHIVLVRFVRGKREWVMVKCEFVPDTEFVGGQNEPVVVGIRSEERL